MEFCKVIEKLGNEATFNSLSSLPDCNPDLKGVTSIDSATLGMLSYIEGGKFAVMIRQTTASALIVPLSEELQQQATEQGIAWIATAEPRLLFAKAIALFYQPYLPQAGIHPSAVIDPSVEMGKDVYIGAHVVIEAGVKIGDGVRIFPNVVVYPNVEIGDRTILHSNCTLHERSCLGADCVIHSGAVIGAEGFGFVPIPTGWYKMQQSGKTVLEDGVEVGCNTCIDRPAVGETRIQRNTKIDNLVQIGHGCTIGENCAIAGQAGMAGGVKLKNRVILAGQVGIANQAEIGDGAVVTAKAGVYNKVAPKTTVSGTPAVAHNTFLKAAALYHRLPEMYKILKKLQKQIEE